MRENIFASYEMLRAIVSDQGGHFDDRALDALLKWYSIIHHLATPYYPQMNNQVEVFNR